MSRSLQLDREAVARREVGRTNISRGLARALAGCFLAYVFLVPGAQLVHERGIPGLSGLAWHPVRAGAETGRALFTRILAANAILLRERTRLEDCLDEDLLVGRAVRPWVQLVLSAALRAGNERVAVGRESWLFYRPDIAYVTGRGFLDTRRLAERAREGNEWTPSPQPDPRKAIFQFHAQLAARGIRLLLVPVPGKPMIHPDKLSPGFSERAGVLQNASYHRFIQELTRNGVLVFDVSEELLKRAQRPGRPQYLMEDTHWRPEAAEFSARRLAAFIRVRALLPPLPATGFRARPLTVAGQGDTAAMLQLPPGLAYDRRQRVEVRQVLTRRHELWRPRRSADLLVLGDSFANVYSHPGIGWEESAGLIEHLSLALQRPVDAIVRNDAGAFATREILSRDLARGDNRLAGKTLVIWQFAMRELSGGDWKLLPMELGAPRPVNFFVPGPGAALMVSGTVRAASASPKPGLVPYKDHILALHLVDLKDTRRAIVEGEALVYIWSMRDNRQTPAARYRPGQRITVKLIPWAEVARDLERVNRSELDAEALLFAEPCWGEEAGP